MCKILLTVNIICSKGISEYYVNECRVNSHKVQCVVDDFKTSNVDIMNKCRAISEAMLITVDPKRVYDDLDFDVEQSEHRAVVQGRLRNIHESIVYLMQKIYEVFKNDSHEVFSVVLNFS